jgi:hypothetical protein
MSQPMYIPCELRIPYIHEAVPQYSLLSGCHKSIVHADIASAYYQISNGDYISHLVAEEKQKREREAQQRKKNKAV